MSLDIWLYVDVDTGDPEMTRLEIPGCSFNYTHNVSPMWREAGCYEALYHSDGKLAGDVLPALRKAVERMEDRPRSFIRLNPANGWGSYDTALPWLREVLAQFAKHPKAKIRVSA